jgi:hypothetical protein
MRPPPAVPDRGLTKGLVLPLEAYEETYPQAATMQRALFLLEDRCMSGFGFTYTPQTATPTPLLSYDASNMTRRYGISDLAEAEASGYSVALPPAPSQSVLASDENRVLTGSPTPGRPEPSPPGTYRGTRIPAGGCVGQAQHTLGVTSDQPLAVQLDHQSLDASLRDPTVATAIDQWSACMKRDGFTVADPLHAPLVAAQRGAQPGSQLDRTVAADDVSCKRTVNLIAIWFTVESKIQRAYIADHLAQLQWEQARLNAEVNRAVALGGSYAS